MDIRLKLRVKKDKGKCTFINCIFYSLVIINMASGIEEILGIEASQISMFCKVMLGIIFVFLIPEIIRKISAKIIMVVFATILISLMQIMFFSNLNQYFYSTLITFVAGCLTSFIVGTEIEDIRLLENGLIKTSYIISFFIWVFLILQWKGILEVTFKGLYSMGLGYALLVPTLCLINYVPENKFKKMTNIICVFGLVFTIIVYCSRGPLLCIGMYFLYYVLTKMIKERKYVKFVIVIIVFVIITVTYRIVIIEFYEKLVSWGIDSRTLRLMIQEEVNLSNRDILWKIMINEWIENPFAIRGINAEYALIGIYAHNIIYELFYQFGLFIGGGIIFIIGKMIFEQLIDHINNRKSDLCIIFLFASIPGLMLSSSIWINYTFWIWVGLSLGEKVKKY